MCQKFNEKIRDQHVLVPYDERTGAQMQNTQTRVTHAGTKEKRPKAKKTQKTKLRKGASKLGKNKSKGLSASRHSSA